MAFSAAAEGAGAPEIESSTYTSSSTSQTSHQTITAAQTLPTAIQTNAVGINGTITAIPNLWSEDCSDDGAPCTAYCHSGDTDCQNAANAIAKTCEPSWSSYMAVDFHMSPRGPDWKPTVITSGGLTSTWTVTGYSKYTSFSTANETFVKLNAAQDGYTTFVPVWGLGKPVPTFSAYTEFVSAETTTRWTAPTPDCKYTTLATTTTNRDCGACTLEGGTVGLYFWPPATDVPSGNASGSTTIVSAVLNGTTLYSPTVYISIATAYATNECSTLGQRHHATLLAMNPGDVSTQIQLGGKAWANSFGAVRYEDLTGLPPASNYQLQPSCIMFGCPTMDNHFSPTLSVPAQLLSMDAAWKGCSAPLQGLYDPPMVLTAAAVADHITSPARTVTTSVVPQPAASVPAVAPIRTSSSGSKTGRGDVVPTSSSYILLPEVILPTGTPSLDGQPEEPSSSQASFRPQLSDVSVPLKPSHSAANMAEPAPTRPSLPAIESAGASPIVSSSTELAFTFDPYTGQEPVPTPESSSPAPLISEDAEGALAPNSPVPQTTPPSPVKQTTVNSASSSRPLPSVAIDGPASTDTQRCDF
ncbi:hypothetical protein TI39_contig4364g00004 [Zymoseptoria brevis]|uniref:Uncharacterized protein n=1 Tax=Zymoseptoria brevis TaxID=1047168 RepID=A0A0F4G7B6_9PEZI|nr:hypothetical protein TI39_contig4364g00004 [Zymoseptoria brevis]